MSWFMVFIGGGLGSVVRYGISMFVLRHFQDNLPIATLVSNVFACLLLALVFSLNSDFQGVGGRLLKLAVVVGFCGGFSTFSTFSYETVQLIKNGNHLVAAGNVIISVAFCLILLYKLTK